MLILYVMELLLKITKSQYLNLLLSCGYSVDLLSV